MAFFTLDPALQESLDRKTESVFIVLEMIDDEGKILRLSDDAVESAYITSYRDSLGGYCVSARVTFVDESGVLNDLSGSNREVHILFSAGDCGRFLHRFTLYVNDSGFIRTVSGMRTRISIVLEDTPTRIKRLGALRNWEEKLVVTDLVMSDKALPEKSLLHLIASRAGLSSEDLDSCSVPLSLVYAALSGNPWDELCALASSCMALLEGGVEKKLLFSSSIYQEDETEEEASFLKSGLFHELLEEEAGDAYTNSIRLKWNRPERLAFQLLWCYEEPPVSYDTDMTPSYPFLPDGSRPIQDESYPFTANYEVREEYQRLPVLWADQIQDQTELEADLIFDADDQSGTDGTEGLTISHYNYESQKALINLNCNLAGSLKKLSIKGRPIVMRPGAAFYHSDPDEIATCGIRIKSGDSRFFSDDQVMGVDGVYRSHPEDWVYRQLAKGIRKRRRFKGKSELGLFYIRSGSLCLLEREEEDVLCRVEKLVLDYHESRGLDCQVHLLEE
ncbi:hypothetical protein EXM22_01865 [Oceanispirochaeta crateris]|uniref:Uncharacterized protein n=1 Tax=Oceanispirochaeta crateris TaxID=2518645 RepID=A0A5C1QJV4_9SPIO|nr:hypothetical protein [Oceanispirochaeta crateris]QEN06796.1 hypothetical protein EXM22_01865 [Oceanispirochaeta crateris]